MYTVFYLLCSFTPEKRRFILILEPAQPSSKRLGQEYIIFHLAIDFHFGSIIRGKKQLSKSNSLAGVQTGTEVIINVCQTIIKVSMINTRAAVVYQWQSICHNIQRSLVHIWCQSTLKKLDKGKNEPQMWQQCHKKSAN